MGKQMMRLSAACALLLLAYCVAGCAGLRSPIAPSGPTPEQQQWIAGSADLAALGCGILMIERPGDVQTARDGLAAAAQVLRSDYPQVIDLATALDHALPRQYAWVTAIVVARIRMRAGDAGVLPLDSVPWQMADTFVETCRQVLQ